MLTEQELLLEAQVFNNKEQFSSTVDLLSDDLLNELQNANLFTEKAQAYYRLKKYEAADMLLDKVLLIDSKHGKASHYKASMLLRQKKYDEAIKLFKFSIKNQLNPVYSYYGLGVANNDIKAYRKAITAYNKAIHLDPSYKQPYAGLGNSYFNLKDHSKSIEYFKKALEIDPEYETAYLGVGNVYFDLKEYYKSIDFYNKAFEINSKNSEACFGLGNAYIKLGNIDRAIEFFTLCVEIDPSPYSYNSLGNAYVELKNYNKALNLYKHSIKIDPKNKRTLNGLGNAYRLLKIYKKSIEFFNKALSLDSGYQFAYFGLGNVYLELDNYEKALQFYSKAHEIDPDWMYALYGLGLAYYNMGDYSQSSEMYSKAINLDPLYADLYYNRALSFEYLEKYAEAVADHTKYLDLTPNKNDYFASWSRSKITELKKLIGNPFLVDVSEIVANIKRLLLFKDSCVTHYTSLSVSKALIIDKSFLRLSEGAFLNDTSEGREIFNFLPPFNNNYSKLSETVAKPFISKPFIGSFVSETKHDDLTLWRMYGKENKDEARGCAITIEREKLLENVRESLIPTDKKNSTKGNEEEFSFYRVAYRKQDSSDVFIIPGVTEQDERQLNEYMANLKIKVIQIFKKKGKKKALDIQNLLGFLSEIAYLFKSAEYHYEHELRLVVKGVGINKIIDSSVSPPRVYVELVDINSLIRKITLGPKVDKSQEWASAFHYSLDQRGFNPEILISHLPFK